ncbi:MAG: sugar phosphate nucleotidyltransferase, partial [Halodesulfurarchaeum sp.]
MKAVVLAAGRGTRLQPLTDAKPKALVEVAGRPLLSYVFDALRDLPVHEVVVVIGYRGEDIIDYYGHTVDGIPVTYTEQEAPRGLADALVAA